MVTLFVPSVFVLLTGIRKEWHVFVDITDEHDEADERHLTIRRRRYGNRMPWIVERHLTCSVARDNVQALGRECCWRETPAAVRHLVLQDLGLVEYREGLLQ